jgi:hypothetical protein
MKKEIKQHKNERTYAKMAVEMLDFDVWDVEELEGAPFFPSQNEQNQN